MMTKLHLWELSCLLAVVLAAACDSGGPQPEKDQSLSGTTDPFENRPRVPAFRLTEELAHGKIPSDELSCVVGAEIRPSLGCLAQFRIFQGDVPDGETPRRLTVELDPFLQDHRLIIERSAKRQGTLDWKTLPPVLLPAESPVFSMTVDDPEISAVELWARPLPPGYRHYRTRPIKIPPGATLQVGLGLDPLAERLGAAPAQMTLSIETKSGSRDLLHSIADTSESQAWQNQRIDLAEFADDLASFHFKSSPATGVSEEAFTVPLWGAPIVVAPGPSDGPPNVIILSLDTLRADYVGVTKQGRRLTPNLDRFRDKSAVFRNAMTTYPSTTGSHMSLFTGVYPATHETIHARKKLTSEITTIAETLSKYGFATAAFTENAMLNAGSGFFRGFDSYREEKGDDVWGTDGAIEETFAEAVGWLENHPNERFFLFLHTYQVHFPYTPPHRHNHFRRGLRGKLPEDKVARQEVWAETGYAGEVIYTDEQVGKLLDKLEELGVLDNSIFIITSDHGEEFGEHGEIGHAQTLYNEVLSIPLSIFHPDRTNAQVKIDEPVSLVDILPTVLELTGVDADESLEGRSLVPLMAGGSFDTPRAIYAQNFGKRGQEWAARTATHKFIFQAGQALPKEIYDLREDPGETNGLEGDEVLATEAVEWINPYKDRVKEAMHRRFLREADQAKPERPLDESVVNKLRALGYTD